MTPPSKWPLKELQEDGTALGPCLVRSKCSESVSFEPLSFSWLSGTAVWTTPLWISLCFGKPCSLSGFMQSGLEPLIKKEALVPGTYLTLNLQLSRTFHIELAVETDAM